MAGFILPAVGIVGGLLHGLFGGGGPSTEELAIGGQERSLASQFMQDYGQMYQADTEMLNQLRGEYTTLTAQGPHQHGFNAQELNAYNTQLLASNNAAYLNSAAVVRNFMAGQGGGGASGITSGISSQIIGDIASRASLALQQGQTNLTLKDFAVGRENYFRGLEGLQNLKGQTDVMARGLASAAGTELGDAYKTAKGINAEKQAAEQQKWAGITGLAGGFGSAISGGIGALGKGESFGEGVKDFFSGAFGGTGAPPPGGVGIAPSAGGATSDAWSSSDFANEG